jgi:hypothetical protein
MLEEPEETCVLFRLGVSPGAEDDADRNGTAPGNALAEYGKPVLKGKGGEFGGGCRGRGLGWGDLRLGDLDWLRLIKLRLGVGHSRRREERADDCEEGGNQASGSDPERFLQKRAALFRRISALAAGFHHDFILKNMAGAVNLGALWTLWRLIRPDSPLLSRRAEASILPYGNKSTREKAREIRRNRRFGTGGGQGGSADHGIVWARQIPR